MSEFTPNHAPPAVENAFEVAFWFYDAALNANEYLQPQKMQRLLFLAQAYFAVAYAGRRLMPAVFVADEMGPIEPNVYAAFSAGRPAIETIGGFPERVEMFLDSIWRRFGHHSADHLTQLAKATPGYVDAQKRGPRGVIPIDSMRRDFDRAAAAPPVQKVMRAKMMRSHTGKPVAVTAWLPGAKPAPPAKAPEKAPGGDSDDWLGAALRGRKPGKE